MILQGLLLRDAFHPPMRGWLRIEDSRIVEISEGIAPEKTEFKLEQGDLPAIISPGFIDAHLHLPQIESLGYDGMELLQWLEQVIYPAEMQWHDPAWAARQISIAYRRLLRAGTLGFAAFLTSHFHGYEQTVRAGHHLPLRAIVGQSMMDRNAPPELLNQPLTRIASSERARVQCSVNPRFALACGDQMLATAHQKATARSPTARHPDLPLVHTHLAESQRECELVQQLFPHDANYTSVYDRHGLLTNRTLLAHCLHLSEDEWDLIAQRDCVVVHCPTANTFLTSGVFDLKAVRQRNIRLALGSDIAAGYELSMPRIARAMIETAKMRAMTIDPAAPIPSPAEAWQLITRGNANSLGGGGGWHDAGRIEVGAQADLLIMQPPFDIDEHLISRLIYTWRDEYITHRIVAGQMY